MSIKRIAKIDQFMAQSSNGNRHMIIQYREYIDASSAGNPNGEIPGRYFYETADGVKLNIISDNTFQILINGEIITRINKKDA